MEPGGEPQRLDGLPRLLFLQRSCGKKEGVDGGYKTTLVGPTVHVLRARYFKFIFIMNG